MPIVLESAVAVRRTAMDLLARREHGRVELARKLRKRGATAELIESALDRLEADGLLDEARYLQCFVGSRARNGYGPLRIREELTQRGLSRQSDALSLPDAGPDCGEFAPSCWRRGSAARWSSAMATGKLISARTPWPSPR